METKNHKGCLTYTINDDGVWVECECGWNHNMGFSASPAEAQAKYREHIGKDGAIENLNVPIIDVMEDDELSELENALWKLRKIVQHRRQARRSRLEGNIDQANMLEFSIDVLYKGLPEWARW